MDTALDYIDYDEKLAGTKLATEHRELQNQVLALRAKLNQRPEEMVLRVPVEKRPSIGHPTSRISVGGLYSTNRSEAFSTLRVRPALHGLEDQSYGYSPDLSIRVADTELAYGLNNKQLDVRNIELVEVRSISPSRPMIRTVSTLFGLGREYLDQCTPNGDSCHRSRFRFAGGLSVNPLGPSHLFYFLGGADIGYVSDATVGWNAGPTLIAGHRWEISDKVQWVTSISWLRRFGFYPMTDKKLESSLQWNLSQEFAFRANLQSINSFWWTGLETHFYF